MNTNAGIPPHLQKMMRGYKPPAAPDEIARSLVEDPLDNFSPAQIRAVRAQPLTLDIFINEMVPELREWVARSIEPLVATIARQEAEAADMRREFLALKERPPPWKYCGVWSSARNYAVNELCTYQGSLFIALRETTPDDAPGSSPGFQLVCKRGRDAKAASLPPEIYEAVRALRKPGTAEPRDDQPPARPR